jgi:hypothetical protein
LPHLLAPRVSQERLDITASSHLEIVSDHTFIQGNDALPHHTELHLEDQHCDKEEP